MNRRALGENIAREWSDEPDAPGLWDALQVVKSDPSAGIATLECLANNRSRLAKVYLGDIHLKGKYGVPEDREAGEFWLGRSAQEGSTEGAFLLAWHLLKSGRHEVALAEFRRLADLGYSPASFAVGLLYYRREVVEHNRPLALRYFRQGEAQGHFYASNWACRIKIRGDLGLRERIAGAVKIIALLVPFLRTVWSHPNSDRLRV